MCSYGKRLAQEVLDRQAERLQLSELVVTRKVECSRLRGLVWGCVLLLYRLAPTCSGGVAGLIAGSRMHIQHEISAGKQP